MYGLDDSGRKFYLKVKEILLGMGFEVMHEDNAFFYLRQDGELIAMISCHVDNFKIAASEDFGQQTSTGKSGFCRIKLNLTTDFTFF